MKHNNKTYSIIFFILIVFSIVGLSIKSTRNFNTDKNCNTNTANNYNKQTLSSNKAKISSLTKALLKEPKGKILKTEYETYEKKDDEDFSNYQAYLSSQASGIIGTYKDNASDDPSDNVFFVLLEKDITANDKVVLCYTLSGVEDASNVTYSINDYASLGGYLIKKTDASSKQKVQINPDWLKKGENKIQFSVPSNSTYGYKIENLSLEIESSDKSLIVVNNGYSSYNKKAYVQGFVKDDKAEVFIGRKKIETKNGVFEFIAHDIKNNKIELVTKLDGKSYSSYIEFKNNIKPDYAYDYIPSYNKIYKVFEKGKADSLQIENAKLNVSDTSLLANKSISVMNLRDLDIPAMDYGMINVTGESNGLRFLPHGEHFKQGTTVSIKYDRAKIPSGYTEDDVKTYYFDNNTKHWEALERDSVDKQLCMVVSKTTHFTDMINGVIKTPESPETQGFTPTMMNDIKAADPTSGIQLIAPPTANNSGSANLSYKIEVPPARNGMSPDLTIQYNSDGGSGWLGEGWDLNIPDIKIDTKFGVPTYNTQFETETYLLNGMMLARSFISYDKNLKTIYDNMDEDMFIADRGVVHTRNNDKNNPSYRFYSRVENSFQLIERIGLHTYDYKWRITDRNGTRYYYGGNDAVLAKDTIQSGMTGNIGEWKLKAIANIYGDSISYTYSLDKEDIFGGLQSKSIYLDKIEGFTCIGKDSYKKHTEIDFIRGTQKNIKTNNARYGFLASSNKLLDKVIVKYANNANSLEERHRYIFTYADGPAVSKTKLLEKITKVNNTGDTIEKHAFNYYNDVADGIYMADSPTAYKNSNGNINNSNNTYTSSMPVASPQRTLRQIEVYTDDYIGSGYGSGGGGSSTSSSSGSIQTNPNYGDTYNLDLKSPISNTKTSSIGGGLYLGVGFGANFLSINNSIGINGTYLHTSSEGESTLIDINGDGLSDKVYVSSGKLYFQPRTVSNTFLSSINISGLPTSFSSYHASITDKVTIGLYGNFKYLSGTIDKELLNVSETSVYFSDVNSDGLVDLVFNGDVYFNYISSYNSNGIAIPGFDKNSSKTQSPMTNITIYNTDKSESIPTTYERNGDNQIRAEASPQQDIVRVWQAPFTGNIKISGNIKLLSPVGDYDTLAYKLADGVRVAIQLEKNELWNRKIKKSESEQNIPTEINTNVNSGQRIFFRVQNGDSLLSNGDYDNVTWAPRIEYVSGTNIPTTNEAGYSNTIYLSSEGNIVSKTGYNLIDSLVTATPIFIKGTFSKPITPADVILKIYTANYPEATKDSLDTNGNPICQNGYDLEEITTITYSANKEYDNYPISYYVSNIGHRYYWFKISSAKSAKWDKIKCYPIIEYYRYRTDGSQFKDSVLAGVKYDIYTHKKISRNYNGPTSYNLSTPVKMCVGFSDNTKSCEPISGTLEARGNDGSISKINFKNLYDWESLYLGHSVGVYFYITLNETNNRKKLVVQINENGVIKSYVPIIDVLIPNNEFGTMWRGWGQFEYNAAKGRYARPIVIDSLFIPQDSDYRSIDEMYFFPLSPHFRTKKTWRGYSDNVALKGDTMKSGRLIMNNIDVTKYIAPNGAYRAPRRTSASMDSDEKYYIKAPAIISKSTGISGSLCAGVDQTSVLLGKLLNKIGLSASLSMGKGNSWKEMDYIDMNGDGFPDYFNKGIITYSNSRGTKTDINSEKVLMQSDKNSFWGASVSGTGNPCANFLQKSAEPDLVQKSIEASGNLSGSIGIQHFDNNKKVDFIDINGDGLPDMINFEDNNKKTVRLNLGYSFAPSVSLESIMTYDGASSSNVYNANADMSLSAGITLLSIAAKNIYWSQGSVMLGFGLGAALSSDNKKLIDINGDGLVDIVTKNGKILDTKNLLLLDPPSEVNVELNTGNGFTAPISWGNNLSIGRSSSTTKNFSSAVTAGFSPLFLPVKFVVRPSFQAGTTNSHVLEEVNDYDGDGFADVLMMESTSKNLSVKYSTIARTNKLKTVTNQFGGNFTIDYARTNPTSEHPRGKWAMTSLVVNDAYFADGSLMKNKYEYNQGKYNRREREFEGFGEVITKNIDTENITEDVTVRKTIQNYDVRNFYVKGNLLATYVLDGQGKLLTKSENKYYTYEVKTKVLVKSIFNPKKNINEDNPVNHYVFNLMGNADALPDTIVAFSPIKNSKNSIYDNNSTRLTTEQSYFEYDVARPQNCDDYKFGDLKSYKSSKADTLSEDGSGSYDYVTTINYKPYNIFERHTVGLPSEVTVKGNDEKIIRHVKAYYQHPFFPSHLTRITQYINASDTASTEIKYDRAGNIIRKVLPSKMVYNYTYDDKYKMYLTQISDTLGYVSKLENYDYRFGIPLKTTDINGNISTTQVDNLGRIISITGANEYDKNNPKKCTIRFEYHPEAVKLNTSDGSIIGPAYAVTKHYDPQHTTDSIETVTFVDGFGRAIQVKKDAYIDGVQQMIVSGKVKYDAFGRAVEAYYPQLGAKNYTFYNYSQSTDNTTPTKTVYDVLDRATQVTLPDGSISKTGYSIANINGQKLLKTVVLDALNNKQATYTDGGGLTKYTVQYPNASDSIVTSFSYDNINQLVKVTDAMGKETLSEYDMAGRRTKVTHPASGTTTFGYDGAGNLLWKYTANKDSIRYAYDFNRLKSITYPQHHENDVKYTYGNDTIFNRKGRLVLQEDGSGAQEFKYGKMGELTEIRRTLVIPNQAVATYTTKWTYDSWNRVQSMIYPDNESVNYTYDLGGNLATVKGASNYINNITYDKFEQRKSITYGNGTVTNYTYDDKNRRLSNLLVKGGVGASTNIMDNSYFYDLVGNVDSVVNKAVATSVTDPVTNMKKNIGGAISHHYHYDNLYRLISANGKFNNGSDKTASYTLAMGYDNLHNITYKKQDIKQTGMQFSGVLNAGYELNYSYNGKNNQQIANIKENNYRYAGTTPSPTGDDAETNAQSYAYDANGNLKSVSTGALSNDTLLNTVNERKLLWDEENRLLAVSDNGYVSNYLYDAAGERTVKMHGGSEGVMVNGKQAVARLGAVDFTAYVSPYLVVSPGGNYTKHIYAGSQRISSILANKTFNDTTVSKAGDSINKIIYTNKINLWQAALKAEYDSLGTKYGKVNSTFGGKGTNTGNLLYFYHPDHLGSSSLVTDASGNVTQHIEYVPYGEVFIEEKNATWTTPYKFNAKELDEETGLYYYGARYYDPKTSVWISVDPLAEKYPNMSSYVYCADNPVKYIDPDGKDWFVNDQGFFFWSDEWSVKGFDYYGLALPAKLNHYYILEKINGTYYHKYTSNLPASLINLIYGKKIYVEKKEYSHAEESANEEIRAMAIGLPVGYAIGKIAGPVIGAIVARMQGSKVIGNMTTFIESALANSKNGLTNIGRALQKHAGRAGSAFENISFSGKTATEDGMTVLKGILNSEKQLIDEEINGTKTIYDKVTGRGVNVSRNGEFNGFRELPQRNASQVNKVVRNDD